MGVKGFIKFWHGLKLSTIHSPNLWCWKVFTVFCSAANAINNIKL